MVKDPNYDRYAGIVSLPGLDGKMPRPFRVDEDGNVIYLEKELNAVKRLGEEKPIQIAETGNLDWNGYEVMRAQGQRDGQVLRGIKDRFFPPEDPNAPLPPASRTYPVPPGYKAWPVDPQHRFIVDANGRPVPHPDYKQAFEGDMVDEKGVALDLAMIGVGAAVPFVRGGPMALRTAQGMVGTSVAKEVYELAKHRRDRKERK